MHRNETVEELKQQIEELQKRIVELDAGCLLHHQTRSLACEMRDIHKAAAKLKSIRNEVSGSNCASEVAKSLGVLWLGSVITYWLKASLKLGHKVSGVMLLVTAVSAALPLGVNGCCRLRKVLLENPKAVDDLLHALAALDQRINGLYNLTSQPPAAGPDCGHVRGPASAVTDIGTVAPGLVWDETTAASPLSGSEDMVHLVPSDWESPTRARHHPRNTFNQPRGRVPAANDADDVHVSTAGSELGTDPVVSVDWEPTSDHVLLSDSQ